MALVRFLSTDHSTGLSRSRFALREHALGVVADSLAARLERATGRTAVRQPFMFTLRYPTSTAPESTYVAENIAALLPGNGSVPGVILITAHYDAIATRTAQWGVNWKTWPAPGADDNATGVAAVMESARILSKRDLPFSVLFVLFSGEELDKLGSTYFVEHYGDLFGERIIAVINVDMIGYASGGEVGASIASNYDSGWLAEMIADSASVIEPALPVRLYKPGPSNSDHGSFWDRGIAAVMLIEPLVGAGSINSPFYHTIGDTLGTIDFVQVHGVTRVVVGFVAGLAVGAPEIALLQSDLMIESRGIITGRRTFRAGDTVNVVARVRNSGCRSVPQGGVTRLRVALENMGGTRELFFDDIESPPALDASVVRIPIVLGDDASGENVIRAAVSVSGMYDEPGNNSSEERFAVEAGEAIALMHSFQPNPITGAFPSGSFCINLAREAEPTLELYTIEGARIGVAGEGRWGGTLGAGLSCLACSQLFPAVGRLSSGVYLYRLVLREAGGSRVSLRGRFAVQN